MTSPLDTIQEQVAKDLHYPWRVLVVCTFLNQTHGRGVRPMIHEFFRRVPMPEDMIGVEHEQIDDLLRPLGFKNRRFVTLYRMTRDYLDGKPYREMYGVGPYALDSIDLFVEGKTDGLNPKDTWLRPYLAWRRAGGEAVRWDRDGHMKWRGESIADQNFRMGRERGLL
jgi:hypothetical protein